MIKYDFSKKKILITGGSGGIGSGMVDLFMNAGAEIFITCTSEEKLFLMQNKYQKLHGTVVDMSNHSEVETICQKANTTMNGLDILVCNAGLTKDTLAMRMKLEDWQDVIDINLTANFILNRDAGKIMIKQKSGRVINIASVVGFSGNVGQANYVASKSGLVGMTKTFALEFASRGITYNTIAPGFIETKMTDAIPDAIKTALIAKIPLNRQGSVQDISNAVAFLASDESSYITGTTIHVNGGLYV